MAWMESKLADIDPRMLLAAIQMRRGGNQVNQQDNSQSEMAKLLAQEQLEAAKIANKKAELDAFGTNYRTVQSPMMKGTDIGIYKERLDQAPGYISGVDPETIFREKAATDRAMIGAMASGGSRGGRGGGGEGMTSQEQSILDSQASIAEDQARMAQQKRSGYGSGAANLLAQQQSTQNQGGPGSPLTQGIGGGVSNIDTTIGGMKNTMDVEAFKNAREFQAGQKGREDVLKIANAEERFRLGDTSALNDVSEDQATKLLGEKRKEVEEGKLSNKVQSAYKEMYDTPGFNNVLEKSKTDPLYGAIITEIDNKMRDKVAKATKLGKPINYRAWLADLIKQTEGQRKKSVAQE